MKNPFDTGVSTFANRYKPTRRPKFAKELPPLTAEKNYFLKFPSLQKFLKPQPHNRHIKTKKLTRQ
jgi:hypothetical protein